MLIRYGIPRGTETLTIPRTERTIRRIIITARHGSITLDVFQWIQGVGMSLYVIRDGEYVCYANSTFYDANLQRAQSLAAETSTGVEIVRYLLTHKVRGQRDVLKELNPEAAFAFERYVRRMTAAKTLEQCHRVEREAAKAYWTHWADVSLRFSGRVKTRWKRFGARKSSLSSSARLAENPPNAILNFAYNVLANEAGAGCLALGLNPLLGLSHKDNTDKPGLAHDIMEVGRPFIDQAILNWIGARVFKPNEFYELDNGVCRLDDDLLSEVAGIVVQCLPSFVHHWEWVAHRLVDDATGTASKKRTPLTEGNRKRRFANAS
ncbi:CRISPR-associated endonuclease Cas1 [Actinocrispum wychmicini]|uniref:CRISPR-associated endonuclease Cas1 n=1 Tax=Actinocrispum wychmicini TaxID=1213861 RepID=UPI001FB62CC8|nr:CRISPR-associated endonuclease Cas1 [Actinocrispum wychmicini]